MADKGRGWYGDPEEHAKVGRKGGEARKKQIKNDPDMSYEELGRKGGEATSQSHGRDFYEKIGRKGGKS